MTDESKFSLAVTLIYNNNDVIFIQSWHNDLCGGIDPSNGAHQFQACSLFFFFMVVAFRF